jgi:tetratricopeptide (TPR) repeat protein
MIRIPRCSAVVVFRSLATLSFSQTTEDHQNLAAHIPKAQEYQSEKRPDLAIAEFKAAVALDPANVETQGNLGVLLDFQGKPGEAIPHLRAAVELRPGMAKNQGLLGLAEIPALDLPKGRKDLETAFPLIDDQKFKGEVGLELVSVYTQTSDRERAGAI